jgi:hypothetical protein
MFQNRAIYNFCCDRKHTQLFWVSHYAIRYKCLCFTLLQDSDEEEQDNAQKSTPVLADKPNILKINYLNAFKLLLTNVWQCEKNKHLFDHKDIDMFQRFFDLSNPAKALYVQLLKVKFKWRQVSSIKYEDIWPDKNVVATLVDELVSCGFLEDAESKFSWHANCGGN